jgi:hypothetical protein
VLAESQVDASLIPWQLPLAPMRLFAIGVEPRSTP